MKYMQSRMSARRSAARLNVRIARYATLCAFSPPGSGCSGISRRDVTCVSREWQSSRAMIHPDSLCHVRRQLWLGNGGPIVGVEAALELAKRILDAQEHDLAGGLLQVFRNAQHPAHGLDFHAEVQFGAVYVRAGLEPYKARIQVHISDL